MSEEAKQTGIVTEQGQDLTSTVKVEGTELTGDIVTEDNFDEKVLEKELFGVKPKQETQQVTEQVTTTPPPAEQQTQTTEPDFKVKEDGYLARISELEAKVTAVEEFEQNPYQFIAKYAPAMAKESFNPIVYVQNKINEKYTSQDEFGNKIPFVPDPAKALIPGTPDYAYAMDLEFWKKEAQSILDNAGNEISTKNQEAIQRLETAKKSVKEKYGMTDDIFNQKIWSVLESVENSKALELMADGIMLREQIDTMKKNLQTGVNRSEIATSSSSAGTSAPPKNPQFDSLSEMFGRKHVERAYNN